MSKRLMAVFIAAVLFMIIGFFLTSIAPSVEVAWVLAILLLTVFLFSMEILPLDISALCVMVMLGLTSLLAPIMGLDEGLVEINSLFDGFSSNAVISIIAVMIIGAGLDKTGIMGALARNMLKYGGSTEKRIVPMIAGTVGVISGFMQNVGAAALFLPVVSRISSRANLPISRLLMPMGFCAILGGTLTMVGSSPLILLNDLILNANATLPEGEQITPFSLFSVTPIGIALILSGIAYFVLFGRFILPKTSEHGVKDRSSVDYFKETYGTDYKISEVYVPSTSNLIGTTLEAFETEYGVRTVAVTSGKKLRMGAGGLPLDLEVRAGDFLAVIGDQNKIDHFAQTYYLDVHPELDVFSEVLSPANAGLSEIIIPPSSPLVGESARTFGMRSGHGVSTLAIRRSGKLVREGEDVRSIPFEPGDMVITYANWQNLARFHQHFGAVVTTSFPQEEVRANKVVHALIFFALAMSLVLFTDLRLSVALLVGALGIIISGVLDSDEAYHAISWKTVFLLASLIPLGRAVESSGTASWIADQILSSLGSDVSPLVLQLVIAVLATVFTLVMSNVGATVLLVPLAINIALQAGANPGVFALTVALATSNAFILPTHQVNALIYGPGGYKVTDFMKAGGVMTIIFLVVLISMMQLVF